MATLRFYNPALTIFSTIYQKIADYTTKLDFKSYSFYLKFGAYLIINLGYRTLYLEAYKLSYLGKGSKKLKNREVGEA